MIHVDDGIIAGPEADCEMVLAALSAKYGIKNLGFPKKFCGIQIEARADGALLLHQTNANIAFLDDLEAGSVHTKGLPTPLVPMDPGLDLTEYADNGTTPPNDAAYRFAVGYIGWLISRTMPKLRRTQHDAAR